MDIVYFDLGYGAGIDGVTCVENEEYNPINGFAFTKEGGGTVTLPVPRGVFALAVASYTKAMSVRFSIYNNANSFIVVFNKSYSISVNGFHDVVFSRYMNSVASSSSTSYTCYSIRNLDGTITNTDYSSADTVSSAAELMNAFGNSISFIFPSASAGECYVSNVIVSVSLGGTKSNFASAFPHDYFPVKLPLKDTSSDFISLGDGEYLGDSAGQKLLSVVDAQDVITKFGASSKVSHLISYGHPGYRVGSDITSATGITEENSSIAAHGSCALSTDTVASAAVAWAVGNTRLSDVDGMKIGWRV